MTWENYIEKELISKRFILAVMIIVYFAWTGSGEGIAGTVVGYYFGTHTGGNVEPCPVEA